MSRITEMLLEPQTVYEGNTFTVKIKVRDDYKYKKYIVSENIKYTTIQGSSFTLTNVNGSQPGSILEIVGKSIQNGTPTPDAPIEIQSIEKSGFFEVVNKNLCTMDRNNPAGNFNYSHGNATSVLDTQNRLLTITPNSSVTQTNKGIYWQLNTAYYTKRMAGKIVTISFYIRAASNCTIQVGVEGNSGNNLKTLQVTPEYQREYITFSRPLTAWTAFIFYEKNNTDAIFYIKDIQVEIRNQQTEYTPRNVNNYLLNLGTENILNYVNTTITSQGLTTQYTDGIIKYSGTPTTAWANLTSYANKNFEPGAYTLSIDKPLTYSLYIRFNNGSANKDFSIPAGQTSVTINLTESQTRSYLFFSRMTAGTNYDDTIKVQLEKGTVAHAFTKSNTECYIIGGIEDYTNKIKQSTGKNKFNNKDIIVGYINANGTIQNDTNYKTSGLIQIKPNTDYYKTYTASPRTKFYNENKELLDTSTYQDISIGGNAGTFRTPENAHYLRFSFPINTVGINTIQIEERNDCNRTRMLWSRKVVYREKYRNSRFFKLYME